MEKIVSMKKGAPMEFVTFEDQTTLYDATFFPNIYRRYRRLLATNQAYVVIGVVEGHFGTVTLRVSGLQPLSSPNSSEMDASFEEDAPRSRSSCD